MLTPYYAAHYYAVHYRHGFINLRRPLNAAILPLLRTVITVRRR